MTLFSSFFIALLVSMLLVPPLMRVSARLGLVDVADVRKVHHGVIPRSGGIAIVLGALVPLFIWWPDEPLLRALILGVIVIFVFGVLDDRKGLHYTWKFFGQLLAVGIMIAAGLRIEVIPFLGIEPVSAWISIPLTVLFVVGVTNAINLSDGLDGLAAGTSLVALAAIAWLFFEANAIPMALMSLATLGGVCGFLRYNNHPAVIFMGDTGSQFLGFVTAVLAIILTQHTAQALNPALLLLLLGVPILDTVTVMVWRMRRGRSPFLPDRNHFHHRLLELGFYHYEAVSIIYVVQALMVSTAYVLRYEGDLLVVGTYALFSLAILGAFRWARVSEFRAHGRVEESEHRSRALVSLSEKLTPYAPAVTRLAEVMVAGLLLFAAFYPSEVSRDFGWLCVILAVVTLFARLLPARMQGVAARLSVYMAGVAAVFALIGPSQFEALSHWHVNGLFLAVGALMAVAIRLARREQFRTTPLDFLVLVFVVAVVIFTNVQAESATRFQVADSAIRLAVFFYASEFLCRAGRTTPTVLPLAAVAGLSILAARGLA